MIEKLDRDGVLIMLTGAAKSYGLTLRDLYELGTSDKLDEPELRDLWLIWGDIVSPRDLDSISVA